MEIQGSPQLATPEAGTDPKLLDTRNSVPNDTDIITLSNGFFSESKTYHDELKSLGEINQKYYEGNQTDRTKIKTNFSNAVENKIFEAVETIVPIVTSKLAEFLALPAEENEVSEKVSDVIQKALSAHFRNLQMPKKMEIQVRRALIYRFSVFKIFWNKSRGVDGEIDISLPLPGKIRIPKFGMSVVELPFLIEDLSMTYEDMVDSFGKEKADEAIKQYSGDDNGLFQMEVKKVRIVNEIWTNHWHAYRIGNVILKSEKNPNWNFDESTNNFLEEPSKPYVFLSPYRFKDTVIGDTSQIEQSIPVQDIINVCLRTMFNHTKKMGNGTWLIDSAVMTEEEARNKISNAAGLIIFGRGVADSSKVRRDSPPALPNNFHELLIQAERVMDNIWGTHSTTRGERGESDTLGAKQLQKVADIGRQDLLVREIEQATAEIGNWIVQLMKMFYDQEHSIPLVGNDMSVEFLKITKDQIKQNMKVIVKEGSTLPTDPQTERAEALELFTAGALDPITLYKKLKLPNPEEVAQRLLLWQQGQLPQPTPVATPLGLTSGAESLAPPISVV